MRIRSVARRRRNALVLDTYAVVLARNGDFVRALRTIDRAIEVGKGMPYLKVQRVQILANSGNRAKAAEELALLSAREIPEALRGRVDSLKGRLATGH